MKGLLDAEMNPAPPPRIVRLNGMVPPARMKATQRWILPQDMNSDTGTGGNNIGHYFVPPKGRQTSSDARKPPTPSHGQLRPPHTATQSDSAKHQQLSTYRLQQSSTVKLQQPSTIILQQPSTVNLQRPSTVKLQQAATVKLREWQTQAEAELLRRFPLPEPVPLPQAPPSPPPSSTATPTPPPTTRHTPPTSTTTLISVKAPTRVPRRWLPAGMPTVPAAHRQTPMLRSPPAASSSVTTAQSACLRSKLTSSALSQCPQSALKNIMYYPIPHAVPRPPKPPLERSQMKSKAPRQIRLHDRSLPMIEESNIENDSALQAYLHKRWPPVIDDSDDSDDSDGSEDSEDSDDSDDSNIENEPLLQTPPHESWLPVIEGPDTETIPAV